MLFVLQGKMESGELAVSPTPPQPITLRIPEWQEIGRPSPEQAPDWITWVAPLDDHGAALYRILVIAESSIGVAVELHSRRGSGHQTIYRNRHGLPPDPVPAVDRVNALLRAADEAVSKVLQENCSGLGMTAPHEKRWSHAAGALLTTQEAAAPVGGRDPEHDLRERAYFLWEREGRPEGRAQEFWERAHRKEVRAA
jgi:hypothetical protein